MITNDFVKNLPIMENVVEPVTRYFSCVQGVDEPSGEQIGEFIAGADLNEILESSYDSELNEDIVYAIAYLRGLSDGFCMTALEVFEEWRALQ